MRPIGIFGGTFDPIHLGHLAVANAALKQCVLEEIKFIPCYQSLHKLRPIASDDDRINMLKLAITNNSNFSVDARELKRGGVSYMVDTLKSLKQEYEQSSLCLIMSMDAFSKFNTWHNWQEVLESSNLIVANRPNSRIIAGEVKDLLTARQVFDAEELSQPKGSIFLLTIPPNDIAATKIRNLIKAGNDASDLVPTKVWHFIRENKVYSK